MQQTSVPERHNGSHRRASRFAVLRSGPAGSGGTPVATRVAQRFDVLDSWRGVAAIMVVLFHSQVASHIWPIPLVRAGEMFVDFFFVLSGFVIANAYAARIRSGSDLGRFMVLRIGRIFPLHLVMLLLFVAAECVKAVAPGAGDPTDAAFSGSNVPGSIATNLVLLQAFHIHDTLTWNTPSWSISAEFFAYALFGLAAFVAGRRLWMFAAAAMALSFAVLLVLAPRGMESAHDFGVARALYGFSIGVVLQRFAIGGLADARAALLAESGRRRRLGWTVVELLAVVCVVLIVVEAHKTPMAYAAPIVFAFAVQVFAHEAGLVSKLLRQKFFLLLGTLSYSIYMIHMFVEIRFVNVARLAGGLLDTDFLGDVAGRGRFGTGIDLGNAFLGDLVILTILGSVVAISYFSYRFVEAPGRRHFRALGERLFGRGTERLASDANDVEVARAQLLCGRT
jgi:peptidoglycan/LPS O-acetylase OafA/YrhL